MSSSARSLFVFSIYIFVLGVVLMAIPNVLLNLFGLPETHEVWIRVLGMLTSLLGYYYFQAARNELKNFFQWTVYTRASVILFFIGFVLLDFVSPILILFGVIDTAGALWTHLSLRAERKA